MSFLEGMEKLSGDLRAGLVGSAGIEHRLSKGEARERIVAEALRPHIPGRFRFSSGEVLGHTGERSSQLDVLILDGTAGGSFVEFGGIGVFPFEVVAAATSVRSELRVDELEQVIANVASFKARVPPLQRSWTSVKDSGVFVHTVDHQVFGGIFAFRSAEGSKDVVPERFADICLSLPPQHRPDALVVLDRYCVLWGDDPANGPVEATSPKDAYCCLTIAAEQSVLFFYLSLMSRLSSFVMPPLNYSAYLAHQQPTFEWKAFMSAVFPNSPIGHS